MNLLKIKDLCATLGVSRFALLAYRKNDPTFPKPLLLAGKSKRWKESDITEWLEKHQAA